MGGKTNTSTQQVQIPQNVLDRYNSVNSTAQSVASTPFQSYSSDPSAFVAPLTATQNAGIAGTNAAANQAQPAYAQAASTLNGAADSSTPYYGAATQGLNAAGQTIGGIGAATSAASPYNTVAGGLSLAGAQAVDPSSLDAGSINKYISPYLGTVLGSTEQLLNQQNTQQQNSALGNVIKSGGFGGDRAGIAAANLNQQQNLANASIYSGILNNAYGQALQTAQGQQALGLSAAQANRAALAGASGQIQGLGQQVYQQGTGAEQLQYGQQTGLAGAQQGLGQAIYAQGANQAETQAGLGAGAQSAALQGAQAQLAAGQQQQQTDQAGKTALYNQYLMQQSYPFQVSQFLANIAEGTGSLSGQTTTTTQPGSLFSDERLKENKRLVGFTFDRQPIFVYNYKGDDTAHMGLMAQDVEKKHPDAVGESGGFKTVNYDQATAGASERGHFRKGGLVPYRGYAYGGAPTGFDPNLAASMMQNSQGMFGPYMTGQGGFAGAGGGPYGASARVPAANLPVQQLHAPPPVKQQEGGLSDAVHTANDITGLVSSVEKGADWVKNKIPANDPWKDGPPEDVAMRRGGRARFADGGMPYQGGLALQIPDDEQHYHLPDTPGAPGGGPSTSGDLGTIASMAKIATMFLKTGGAARGGFAGGGLATGFLSDEDNQFGILGNKKDLSRVGVTAFADGGTPNFDETGGSFSDDPDLPDPGTTARAHIENPKPDYASPNFDETGLSFQPTMKDKVADTLKGWSQTPPSHAPATHKARGSGLAAADPWPNGPPTEMANPQPNAMSDGPSIAAPPPAMNGMDLDQTPPSVNMSGAGNAGAPGPTAPDGGAPDHHAMLSSIVDRVAPPGSYIDKLFHGDKMTIIPFLAALGAATGARTSNTFTALAQGAAAGAKSYQDLSKQQADIEQTQANTGRIGVGTQMDIQAHAPAGYQAVPGVGPKGEVFYVQGKPYHYALQASTGLTDYGGKGAMPGLPGAPAAAGAPPVQSSAIAPSKDTDAFMAQNYGVDLSQPGVANRTRLLATNPALASQEAADEKRAQDRVGNLGEADMTHRNLLQSADALSKMSKGTLTGQGYESAQRAQLTNLYSTVRGMLGLGTDETAGQDLTAHQITEKIRQLTGPQIAHQYGERAASIAHGISAVLPNGDLTPDASAHILAQMMVQNQQQRDFSTYHNGYVAKYGTPLNVEPSFQKDSGRVYDQDQANLTKVLRAGQMDTILGYLNNSDPATRAAAMQKIDQKFGSGFHRYFSGGQ